MASPIHWTWTWANSGRWWGTEKSGVPQSMGLKELVTTWWSNNKKNKWMHLWEIKMTWLFHCIAFFLDTFMQFFLCYTFISFYWWKMVMRKTLARFWGLFLCGFNWHSKHQEEHITACKKSHIFNLWSENINWPILQNAGWNKMVIRVKKELWLFSMLRPLSHQII